MLWQGHGLPGLLPSVIGRRRDQHDVGAILPGHDDRAIALIDGVGVTFEMFGKPFSGRCLNLCHGNVPLHMDWLVIALRLERPGRDHGLLPAGIQAFAPVVIHIRHEQAPGGPNGFDLV